LTWCSFERSTQHRTTQLLTQTLRQGNAHQPTSALRGGCLPSTVPFLLTFLNPSAPITVRPSFLQNQTPSESQPDPEKGPGSCRPNRPGGDDASLELGSGDRAPFGGGGFLDPTGRAPFGGSFFSGYERTKHLKMFAGKMF